MAGSRSYMEKISAVVVRDFLIHIKARGHTAPLAARAAISTWADPLQMDWKYNDRLVKSAMIDQESRKVAQAPLPARISSVTRETRRGRWRRNRAKTFRVSNTVNSS